jgi:hypothetical protein
MSVDLDAALTVVKLDPLRILPAGTVVRFKARENFDGR